LAKRWILKGKIMIKWLFRISVSIGLAGMAFGIAMGITQNFVLLPAHAHLNLLGYVPMFLSALYYRAVPEAASSRLAPLQAIVSGVGAILFPIGIACVLIGGHERFEPVVIAGAFTVLVGMLLFAVIVYRTSGRAASRTAAS
jgi:drug/metabolite transporter (DMT)-like permease